MTDARVGVGIVGAGSVSDQYLDNLTRFPDVRVVAVGSRHPEKAAAQAAKHGVAAFGDVDSVLANDEVEIVVNLTIPAVHAGISMTALDAGKHVWSEKPLGVDRRSARSVLACAQSRGLLVGVAPDTVLGPMWQTAKRAIQAGVIGTPLSAVTAFQSQGPEFYHAAPEFLFAKGAGPLFDIGPYYLTALVYLLGPLREVVAVGSKAYSTRTVKVGPKAGTVFPVDVPTHLSVASIFEGGELGSSLMSTDTALWRRGVFEINGTEGTLVIGDPDLHSGHGLRVFRHRQSTPGTLDRGRPPERIAETGVVSGRGLGVLTMARTLRGTDLHIATGRLGYHVLDAMVSIEESIERKEFVKLTSTVGAMPALPDDFDPFTATLR
jgi:predicted dehydrogenase